MPAPEGTLHEVAVAVAEAGTQIAGAIASLAFAAVDLRVALIAEVAGLRAEVVGVRSDLADVREILRGLPTRSVLFHAAALVSLYAHDIYNAEHRSSALPTMTDEEIVTRAHEVGEASARVHEESEP